MSSLRTLAYTAFALVAFAANSVLCRLALGEETIDAASFSTIRLVSGALTLVLVSALLQEKRAGHSANWVSAVALFLYAVPFSYAYVTLSTGTGALILFAAVQSTMIVAALRGGERPVPREWGGLGAALAGLVYLVFPGLTAPTPLGSGLMALSGIAWGVYSLRGRAAAAPVATTTGNFVRTVPFAAALSLVMLRQAAISPRGALLAIASGAVTSGLGYVVWYAALPGLTVTRAAMVQLCVPVIAGLGGVVFLAEVISLRLLVSAAVIFGGVSTAVLSRAGATASSK